MNNWKNSSKNSQSLDEGYMSQFMHAFIPFNVFYLHYPLQNLQSEILDLGMGLDFGSSPPLYVIASKWRRSSDSANNEHKKLVITKQLQFVFTVCIFIHYLACCFECTSVSLSFQRQVLL